MSRHASYPCDWYDEKSKALCSFESNRQFNLERHIQNTHEKRDTERYEDIAKLLSDPLSDSVMATAQNTRLVRMFGLNRSSSLHLLVVPIRPLGMFDALQDRHFLAMIQKEAQSFRKLVGKELQILYGPYSIQDQPREAVLDGKVQLADGEDIPPGRDWAKEVKVGILAKPSIDQFHIHILSPDMCSPGVLHHKHYNAFNTPFFIDVAELPLTKAEMSDREKHLYSDPVCWRCKKSYSQVGELKDHLAEEFEQWKAE